MSKKTVSIFTTIQGHWSLAKAMEEYFLEKFDHVYVNKHSGIEFFPYIHIYRKAPWLFGLFYELSKLEWMQDETEKYFLRKYTKIVNDQINTQKPDLIVSTWYGTNPAIHKSLQQQKIPFLNMISNPRSIHPFELTKYGTNLVFDQIARSQCIALGIDRNLIKVTGWFVQKKFYEDYDQTQVRMELGLSPNASVFLFQTGSEGTEEILNTIKKLVTLPTTTRKGIEIVLSCGRNANLYKKAMTFKKQVERPFRLYPLPLKTPLIDYMRAADLVIGKAGPNTIFEAVATKTPFFATSYLSGHETGNLEIINDYKIGLVAKKPLDILSKLSALTLDSNALNFYKHKIEVLRYKNQEAFGVLNELV